MSTLPRQLLPESLRAIADYCGEDIMWTIWENYGGGRLHVPLRVEPDHTLSQLLGFANACRFCQQFGGEFLTIAKGEAAKRAVRNAMIRQAKHEGLDNLTLARRFQLTDRQIMKICEKTDAPAVNYDLFNFEHTP